MRELNSTLSLSHTEAIVKEVSRQKFVGQIKPHKGHFLWEYDLLKKTFIAIEPDEIVSDLNGKVTKKVKIREGCLYASALTSKSADKKFIKMIIKILDDNNL